MESFVSGPYDEREILQLRSLSFDPMTTQEAPECDSVHVFGEDERWNS